MQYDVEVAKLLNAVMLYFQSCCGSLFVTRLAEASGKVLTTSRRVIKSVLRLRND